MFLGFLTLLQPVAASAQAPEDGKISQWATVGFGTAKPFGQWLGLEPDPARFSTSISFNFGRRWLHQVRVVGSSSSGITSGPSSFLDHAPLAGSESEFRLANAELAEHEFQRSFSYALGRGRQGSSYLLALFAGPGVVSLKPDTFGSSGRVSRVTVGLTLNAQAAVYLYRGFGVGIDVYANLNTRATVGALYMMIVMGGNRRPTSN